MRYLRGAIFYQKALKAPSLGSSGQLPVGPSAPMHVEVIYGDYNDLTSGRNKDGANI